MFLPLASLSHLLAAPTAIQIHVFAAIAAFMLGAAQLVLPKGTTNHRLLGWTWVILMAIVAVSSFFIVDFRNLTPTAAILVLSIAVLIQLPVAIHAARRGNIELHRRFMRGMFYGALVLAGAFTLLPGRLLGRVVFG